MVAYDSAIANSSTGNDVVGVATADDADANVDDYAAAVVAVAAVAALAETTGRGLLILP